MTLHTFVKTIKTAGGISDSLNDTAIELYHCSGIGYEDETIKKALKNNKPLLPKWQNSIDEWGFLQFFENRTNSTWQEMQMAFGELDEYVLVDRATKDRNVFYESLLAQFYDIIRLVPVSLLDILPQAPLVFGREKELKQFEDIFETSNYAILTGVGGIGKSCVALAYAHALKKTGSLTVQHIICENDDTLQTAIIKLQFNGLTDTPKAKKNADKENLGRRIDTLKTSAKRMLILLDNLNQPFTEKDLDTFKRLIDCGNHVHILITSRNTLTDDKQGRVHLDPLDDDALFELYAYHRFENVDDHKDYIAQHRDILMKLFSIVEKHTLMIELLAKLPNRLFADEYEIYNRLSVGLRVPFEGISIKKDGEIIKAPPEGLVKILFDSSNLTDDEKSVMRYMSIMPVSGIEIKLFEELTHCSRKEILGLKKSHWIAIDEEKMTIRLHPLICEAILSFDDTKPTMGNCNELISLVKKEFKMIGLESTRGFTLGRIVACYVRNVCLRELTYSEFFDYFQDQDKELIFFYNKIALAYANANSSEEWAAANTMRKGKEKNYNDDNDS